MTEVYGYKDAVIRPGDTIVDSLWAGDYQGDLYMILQDSEGRYGFTVIGYGSCSGCDWWEATRDDAEYDWETKTYRKPEVIDRFVEQVQSGVQWFDSKMDLKVKLRTMLRERETYWYSNDKEWRAWAERQINSL